MKDLRGKHYKKWIKIRDNGNVQTYDQEESKLNSTINTKSGAQTFTNDKIIKNPSNKNDAAAIKSNLNSNKTLITRACWIGTVVSI